MQTEKSRTRSEIPPEVQKLARLNREMAPIDISARRQLLKAQAAKVIERKKEKHA